MADICPFCGTHINLDAVVCTGCGAQKYTDTVGNFLFGFLIMFGLWVIFGPLLGYFNFFVDQEGFNLYGVLEIACTLAGPFFFFGLIKHVFSKDFKPSTVWKRRQ